MKRWPTKPLGELAESVMGQAPPGSECNFDGVGTPFVKAGEFGESRPIIREWTTKPLKFAKANDVLVCVVGATCGKLNLGTDCAIGRSVAAIRPDENLLNTGFLYAFLQGWTKRLRSGSQGSAQGVITRDMLASIPIPVPPLAEQERIVKLLDEADELRKLRAQADRRTAALLPALFHQMFGEMERGPKKWPTKAVADVCDLVRGSSPRPKSDPRYYGGPIPRLMIEDITRDGWSVTPRVDSLTELGATMSRRVRAGTIVMAVSGNIGLCAQLAVDACVHDGFVAFKDLRADVYLPLFFGMAMGQMRQAHQRSQAGAIFQNITTTDVKAMKIPAPPLPLQKEFAQRVTEIRALECAQATSRQRLEALFQSLLHRAFNGEL
jgi:restriction endonuclease S subunit